MEMVEAINDNNNENNLANQLNLNELKTFDERNSWGAEEKSSLEIPVMKGKRAFYLL